MLPCEQDLENDGCRVSLAEILAALGVILLVKPLAALFIVSCLGYSVHTALTVAIGLAQIGEFSFILSDLEQMTAPEIGSALGVNINTVYYRISSARKAFAAYVGRTSDAPRGDAP